MAGTSEQKLMKALSARPGQLHDAAKAWRKAASGLEEIAAALDTGKTQISQSWQGTDADAATAAFSSLATTVRANKSRMQQAAGALDLAGDALHQAKSDYDTLPPVPPVPQSPEPDDSGSVSIQDEVHYLKLSGARSTAMSKREAAAATSYKEAVGTLSDAQIKMAEAAPETHKRLTDDGLDDTVAGPGSDAGGSTGGGSSLPGGAGRPVGAYGTGTGGTHASAQLISSSAPHLQDQLGVGQLGAQVITTGTEGVSVDGVVSGSVPSVSEGLAGNGSGVLNGSTGACSVARLGGWPAWSVAAACSARCAAPSRPDPRPAESPGPCAASAALLPRRSPKVVLPLQAA